MRLRQYLFLAAALFFTFRITAAVAQDAARQKPEVLFFYSYSCHECSRVKSEILPGIEKQFAGRITIRLLETGDMENYKMLLGLKEQYGFQANTTPPVMFMNGEFLTGEPAIRKNLAALIEKALAGSGAQIHQAVPVDMMKRFLSFSLLAIIGAGLIDGINPCAFTVIVFFISYLGLQGYSKKKLVVIGSFYIIAVFITYLLIGLGLFNFLYSIEKFWMIRKIFNLSVGILSIVFGALALYDFLKFRKTGSAEGMALQLPQAVKNRIHSVIGLHYRRQDGKQGQAVQVHTGKLILSALVTGFLVSILESICTGQVYLPTITLILKTTNIKLQAFGYLVFYNFLFIVPLCVVFLLALWGTTSRQFSEFLNRHMLTVKILMVILFFGLGGYLIWRA